MFLESADSGQLIPVSWFQSQMIPAGWFQSADSRVRWFQPADSSQLILVSWFLPADSKVSWFQPTDSGQLIPVSWFPASMAASMQIKGTVERTGHHNPEPDTRVFNVFNKTWILHEHQNILGCTVCTHCTLCTVPPHVHLVYNRCCENW